MPLLPVYTCTQHMSSTVRKPLHCGATWECTLGTATETWTRHSAGKQSGTEVCTPQEQQICSRPLDTPETPFKGDSTTTFLSGASPSCGANEGKCEGIYPPGQASLLQDFDSAAMTTKSYAQVVREATANKHGSSNVEDAILRLWKHIARRRTAFCWSPSAEAKAIAAALADSALCANRADEVAAAVETDVRSRSAVVAHMHHVELKVWSLCLMEHTCDSLLADVAAMAGHTSLCDMTRPLRQCLELIDTVLKRTTSDSTVMIVGTDNAGEMGLLHRVGVVSLRIRALRHMCVLLSAYGDTSGRAARSTATAAHGGAHVGTLDSCQQEACAVAAGLAATLRFFLDTPEPPLRRGAETHATQRRGLHSIGCALRMAVLSALEIALKGPVSTRVALAHSCLEILLMVSKDGDGGASPTCVQEVLGALMKDADGTAQLTHRDDILELQAMAAALAAQEQSNPLHHQGSKLRICTAVHSSSRKTSAIVSVSYTIHQMWSAAAMDRAFIHDCAIEQRLARRLHALSM